MSILRKITGIFVVFTAFTALISNQAFSQGKIHLGSLRIYPVFGERIEFDDNVYQVSGKRESIRGREEKQSDLINIYTPGLKLDLPLSGGDFIPGKEHDLNLDWHSDFKNYRDHADQNQQNHYFSVSGNLRFPKGLDVSLRNKYEDTESPAGSETDQIHPRKTYLGNLEINMPDYFRKFDAKIIYSCYDQEYDERVLRKINRFEQSFTLKIPYKLTSKIDIFPEFTYGLIEYDSQGGLGDPQSDSHYNEIYAGIEWYATAKTTGIVKLGFINQDYDDTQITDVNTFVAEIGIKVDLTRRMILDINAGRSPRQSEFTVDSNSFERNFGDFTISRWVRKDMRVSLYGHYEKQVYHDSERKDDIYEFILSTDYKIKKWILADFRYSYRDRHSNIETQGDRINKASIGVNFAF